MEKMVYVVGIPRRQVDTSCHIKTTNDLLHKKPMFVPVQPIATCSRLQCSDMELLFLLRFNFCDVFLTGGIYIAFWHNADSKPQFFASEPFIDFVVAFTVNLRTPSTSLQNLVSIVFDAVSCCFCDFLLCNKGWLFCISFISNSDFSGPNVYRNIDGFFCKCHWNILYCGDLSF